MSVAFYWGMLRPLKVKETAAVPTDYGRDFASGTSLVRGVTFQKTQTSTASAIVTFGLIAAMACFGCGGERDQQTSTTDSNEVTTDSNNEVADAVNQYNIAKRSGTPIDQCVRARVVTAAYL